MPRGASKVIQLHKFPYTLMCVALREVAVSLARKTRNAHHSIIICTIYSLDDLEML